MKIVLSVVVAFFLVACSDSSESTSAKKEISKQVEETAKVVSKSTQDVVTKTKEATAVVVEQAKVVTAQSVKQVKETTKKVANEVQKVSAEVATKIEAKAKEVTEKAPTIDGKTIFTKCVGCHGSHGERKALGKSQLIQGWEVSKVVTALNGYKDGSYGGSMKGVMKSQISKLSDDEIQAVAEYISKQ